ncbi:MAG: TRAP transporter small permease [Deltaproteobacteria bacterium]|nr:TRAP transporter small permease [Deltaproteobacteria bacterium]MBW2341907.1 TRAP transporter small permease [Deltaproteobacteria bacterium]
MVQIAYKWIIGAVKVISAVSIALMTLFTAYEVVVRELFGKPTIWTNEITSYLLIWFGLLGIIYAYDKGTHVSVDIIYRRMNVRNQTLFDIVTATLMLAFALCFCMYGYKYWWLAYSRGWRHFGMLDVPMSYTRISLPVVGLLLVFQFAIVLYDRIKALRST